MRAHELFWLMHWFDSQCDGYWEDWYGAHFETTPDIGWVLSICIEETELEEVEFHEIHKQSTPADWYHCYIEDKKFIGKASPNNLFKLLQTFRLWAEQYSQPMDTSEIIVSDEQLSLLTKWYDYCCAKGLRSEKRIRIATIGNPGWSLYIDLDGTGLETENFEYVQVERTEKDWYRCFIRNNIFYGPGGNFNLGEVLEIFQNFVEAK